MLLSLVSSVSCDTMMSVVTTEARWLEKLLNCDLCMGGGGIFFLFFLEYTHQHFQINTDREIMVE